MRTFCQSARRGAPVSVALVLLAALVAALAAPAAAQEEPPSTYIFRIVCKSGKVVLDELPILPEPQRLANEASARRQACPEDYAAPPKAPLPNIDDADLFRQTLGDIVANTFRLRLSCPKACTIKSSVEVVVADKRLLLYGRSTKHALAAGRRVTIPIRFSAADRAKVRGARLVRVNGLLEVSDAKGGKRTMTWRRTCRLGG